jgi:tRNA nucleotidyltransferase/poly(A) polymerase
MRNLYSLYRHFEWPIDLISLSDEENWLIVSLNSRDFRVAALCCDKEGQITDPTGFGLEDLLARRLVMIGCPTHRFKQDPVLLLRALKYMVFGFKPDALIHNALSAWQPDVNTNMSKLYAVTRKHLVKPDDRETFMDLLCQYGLLGKLFNLKNEERAQLLPLLGVRTDVQVVSSYSSYGLFKPQGKSGEEVGVFTNRL